MVPSVTYAISFSLSRTTMSGLFAPSSGHVLSKCWTSQKSLLSSFLLLLMGVAGSTLVANSVGLIDRIFLGAGNIWVLASYHALPYINSVQSECMMSGYVLLTLHLSGIFCMYHQFVD